MKIGERAFDDDGKLIVRRTFDAEPAIEGATALRSNGVVGYSENKLLARLPNWVISMWLEEAGVKHDDPAASDVLRRKLLSGEASKFRVWEGTF